VRAAGRTTRPARNSQTVIRIWPTVRETPSGRCTTSTLEAHADLTSTARRDARLAQIGHAAMPAQK
jgi:hypothetical protein